MSARPLQEKPSRGHKKRARTYDQLIAAGVQVFAERGEALTISDVVAKANVSNGTFYNYFDDRDELIDALSEHSLASLAGEAALQTAEADPALRFAFATLRVLTRATEDPTWGHAILRLTDHRRSFTREVNRYLREDLASGFERGRFEFGPDAITLDAITGLITMTIRRMLRGDAGPGDVEPVVERTLTMLGISKHEATTLVADAVVERDRCPGPLGLAADGRS
ncbi:MAG: TetR/AcrR family transcriptional regulator [Deltaproteobacteria bacterium]|nr:TetR/AcrR family transcriptional regulator [Deltaproteobacteria bacterium]MBW2396614.1 TetR/AcrR family transcriptional regulator [Deltaproteobacteria bacterium]